jgi:hypothetical protein
MNWGKKILTVYILFVLGILLMVFKSSREKDDLVTPDYYAQELKYQQKIDQVKRTNALSGTPDVTVTGNHLQVHFPNDFAQKKIDGDVLLYCPSDENKDVKQIFSVKDEDLLMPIPATSRGLFELHMTWEVEGVKYYFEKKIVI